MLESKTQGKQGNKSTEGRTVSSDREATGCSQGGVIGLTLNLGGACMSVLLFFITYIIDIVCELFYLKKKVGDGNAFRVHSSNEKH